MYGEVVGGRRKRHILSQKNNDSRHIERKSRTGSHIASAIVSFLALASVAGVAVPAAAQAFSFGGLLASIALAASKTAPTGNLQTTDFLRPAMNLNPAPATGGGDVTITDDSALVPVEGPSGTIADIEKPKKIGRAHV